MFTKFVHFSSFFQDFIEAESVGGATDTFLNQVVNRKNLND